MPPRLLEAAFARLQKGLRGYWLWHNNLADHKLCFFNTES